MKALVFRVPNVRTPRGVVSLVKHAQTIARKTGCHVVKRRVANPTLVAHGLVKASRWHLLTHEPPRRAIADLYVGDQGEAAKVARVLANLLGVQLDLLDNRATPADLRAHPRSVVSPGLSSNPPRVPRKQRRAIGSGRFAKAQHHATRSIARGAARRERTARARAIGRLRGNPKGRSNGDYVPVAGRRSNCASPSNATSPRSSSPCGVSPTRVAPRSASATRTARARATSTRSRSGSPAPTSTA
jgi:hypothetical protein